MQVKCYRPLVVLTVVAVSASISAGGPVAQVTAGSKAQIVKAVEHKVRHRFERVRTVDVLDCSRRRAHSYRCHWFGGIRLGVHGDGFWAEGFARAKDTKRGVKVRLYGVVSQCEGSGHFC